MHKSHLTLLEGRKAGVVIVFPIRHMNMSWENKDYLGQSVLSFSKNSRTSQKRGVATAESARFDMKPCVIKDCMIQQR